MSAATSHDDRSPDAGGEPPFGSHRPSWVAQLILALTRHTPLGRGAARKALGETLRKRSASPVDVTLWGRNARLHLTSNYSEMKALLNPDAYSKPDFSFIRRRLPADGIFLDIGANAGMFSLFAASLLRPGGRVICVEPQPDIFRRLQFNMLRANNLRSEGIGVTLVPAALGSEAGEADLTIPDEHGQATLRSGLGGRTVKVPVMTLHDLLVRESLSRVDVMKIDVEGFEDAVLEPFFRTARRDLWPRAVLMEHCNRERWRWDCEGELTRLGYETVYRDRANVFMARPDRERSASEG